MSFWIRVRWGRGRKKGKCGWHVSNLCLLTHTLSTHESFAPAFLRRIPLHPQKTINTPRKSIICYVNIRRGHSLYHPSRRFFFMDPPFCTKLIVTSLCSFILLVSSTLTKFYGKVVQIYNNDSSYNTKRLIRRIIKLKFPYITTHAAQAKWNLDFWKRNDR